MAYQLQMLRALMDAHPDRAEPLRRHVEALEATIIAEPQLCLHRVRTLFESVHGTIGRYLHIDLNDVIDFPARNSRIIRELDFSLPNHPHADRIDAAIRKLLGSINGAAAALAELSNIPDLRHGDSLDWATLERRHAVMLGGLCDTLISFLFEVAWSRVAPPAAKPEPWYDDFAAFNAYLDDEYGSVNVAGSTFLASKILHELDKTQYEAARIEWEEEQTAQSIDREAAE